MRPLLPPERVASLAGFGLSSVADGYVYRPTTLGEIHEVFALALQSGRQVVLRGAGRSYGDASIGSECLILDIRRMDRVLDWDPASGLIEIEGGVTLERIWRHTIEDGYWLPVVSGTMFPTIAGALAMNIHGKNNYRAGTLGEHIESMQVLFPSGELKDLSPSDELFRAVIGGAGLLGVITRARLRLKQVRSGDLRVLPVSCSNWDDQFECFSTYADADYMVSWVDCFAGGPGFGRGLFHAAWHTEDDLERPISLTEVHQDLPDSILGLVPKSVVWRFLKVLNNRDDMRLLNWAKHAAGKLVGSGKMHPQSLVAFSFLLDYVPHWRRSYEPAGFMQYQSFVPKERAAEVFAQQVEMQQSSRLESFLGVLKRHRPDSFLLSHAVDGYSLALDFKLTGGNRSDLFALCHRMNDLVLSAGGKFYLAKDSTLRPQDFNTYIGEAALTSFRRHKQQVDPENLLTSDLAKRLEIVE